jgi:uncharacterized protein YegL
VPDAGVLMPYYLAVDASSDAAPYAPALSEHLELLRRAVVADPSVGDVARLSVLTVDGDHCTGPEFTAAAEMAVPSAGGSGPSGFRLESLLLRVRRYLDSDLQALRRPGVRIYRPILFVLAASRPQAGWEAELSCLAELPRRPVLVPIALSGGSHETLATLAQCYRPSAYYSRISSLPGDAVRTAFDLVARVVCHSAATARTERPRHMMPPASRNEPPRLWVEQHPRSHTPVVPIDCTATS